MCINYTPPKPRVLAHLQEDLNLCHVWPRETWQDYDAPILVQGDGGERRVLLASYGMLPKRKCSPELRRYTTMNARAETIGKLTTYKAAWSTSRLCLVPMERFYEPYYAEGAPSPVRYAIGMADESLFAVAGLWRSWDEEDGSVSHSFTQITINSDEHPLMRRFHKPGDEKRSLVIVPREEYDDWLGCKDPERARAYLNLYPAELMGCAPAPVPPRKPKSAPVSGGKPSQPATAPLDLTQ